MKLRKETFFASRTREFIPIILCACVVILLPIFAFQLNSSYIDPSDLAYNTYAEAFNALPRPEREVIKPFMKYELPEGSEILPLKKLPDPNATRFNFVNKINENVYAALFVVLIIVWGFAASFIPAQIIYLKHMYIHEKELRNWKGWDEWSRRVMHK
ncbi:hypothetical protein FWF89_03525 [Candidatus Saccharibacteria bacterium]|nr:hypothetical protein [Candidatus Saccharibacteria bacterium]